MRHWRLGFPLAGFPAVAGRPCRYWITLFHLCHEPTAEGWRRTGWPDGGPLWLQPWPQVIVLRVVGDELAAAAREPRPTGA